MGDWFGHAKNINFVVFIQIFKTKAIEIADKLLPAFNSPTGIPYAMVNLRT